MHSPLRSPEVEAEVPAPPQRTNGAAGDGAYTRPRLGLQVRIRLRAREDIRGYLLSVPFCELTERQKGRVSTEIEGEIKKGKERKEGRKGEERKRRKISTRSKEGKGEKKIKK
ncbi:hypothetical protein GALMADRAFT_1163157 [Galerina marginata CBS 339.88]|uniref:Uncharacterized protein n=1 Tax=Galerina marginata (strain CBS 339.88) TaxID=685588 RepID=A0A067T971_GALM3|nr:hypothetical protein GALMADRAFT_1163157 [Galerina marginata CBS 339.88]